MDEKIEERLCGYFSECASWKRLFRLVDHILKIHFIPKSLEGKDLNYKKSLDRLLHALRIGNLDKVSEYAEYLHNLQEKLLLNDKFTDS